MVVAQRFAFVIDKQKVAIMQLSGLLKDGDCAG